MKLYNEYASWFHLLSSPADYAEEAEFARQALEDASVSPLHSVLELGSGGGNNASHLKAHFALTLVDQSPGMLALSQSINPECEHRVGDMRDVRLQRHFDAVFVHDAVCYLTTPADLLKCMQTAAEHCKPGGAVLFMPDFDRESFRPGVHHGGHDGVGRSLRHFEWTFDPNPGDSLYTVDFVYMLREGGLPVTVEHETHVHGLFPRSDWLALLHQAGFNNERMVQDPFDREVFVAIK